MAYSFITTRRDGPVEHLTLNRPDVRNAFNAGMIAELTDWAQAIAADRAVRVAVLGGAGRTFSAGADVGWMSESLAFTREENLRDATAGARMFAALDTLPIPLIARVQGAALGGGVGLVSVCDVAIVDDQAVFGLTEVRLGILPAMIAPFVLAKVGRSAARHLFLTGSRFPAEHAREIGLVHAVVPAADLDIAVARVVQECLSAGPEAIAAAKGLIRTIWNRPAEDVLPLTADAIATRRVSAEGQEGLRAFLEKRKPSWSAS